MTRRARFTASEMDRLFSAAKRNGVHVRITLTKDGSTIETVEPDPEIVARKRKAALAEHEDIVL